MARIKQRSKVSNLSLRVGIGHNGNSREYFAYQSVKLGEVNNFTDFIPTTSISSIIVTSESSESMTVTIGNWLQEREHYSACAIGR